MKDTPNKLKGDFWDSLQPIIRTQRLLCISPFSVDYKNGVCKTTRIDLAYITLIFILCYGVKYYSFYFHYSTLQIFVALAQRGILWTILCLYEAFIHNISFIIVITLLYCGRTKQIEFLKRLSCVDQTLANQFNVRINYTRYKTLSSISITVLCIYFGILVTFFPSWAFVMGSYSLMPKLFVYYIQYTVTFSAIFAAIQSAYMVSERYAAIISAYKKLKLDFDRNEATFNKIADELSANKTSNEFYARKFGVLVTLFKELSELMRLSNEIYGWIYVLCVIRTFSVVLIQKYSVILLIFDGNIQANDKIYKTVVLIIINTIDASKLFLCGVVTKRLTSNVILLYSEKSAKNNFYLFQVERCKYLFRQFDKNGNVPCITNLVRLRVLSLAYAISRMKSPGHRAETNIWLITNDPLLKIVCLIRALKPSYRDIFTKPTLYTYFVSIDQQVRAMDL